jgi:hypothetical protein
MSTEPSADQPGEMKKILTRDEILEADIPSKVYELPSGKVVIVKYLTFFLVMDIHKNIESSTESNIERIFTEKVIQWMLRENDQKDFNSFSEEDQKRLIEIAVEEWGCEEEFESLTEIENPEIRFFQAVSLQEKELARKLSESLGRLTANIASSISPLKTIQDEVASSLQGILDQLSVTAQVAEAFKDINVRVMDQIREIGTLSVPIANLAGSIEAIGSPLRMPYESMLLREVGETISSYQNLMKDVLPFERFTVLPDAIRYYPTIEMHNTSVIVGQLLMGDDYEVEEEVIAPDTDELSTWLGMLDPSFPTMLEGANQAIFSLNPDRCRHFASSHRELCTHILHSLAPDDAVRSWTSDPNHFREGRPTRKARLSYIVRNYKNKPFGEFFVRDFSNQMDLLNADEHRKSQDYGENELLLLHERFLSALGFLKKIIGYP